MAATTPRDTYHPVPAPSESYFDRGYGASAPETSRLNNTDNTEANDFANAASTTPMEHRPLSRSLSNPRPASSLGRQDDVDNDRGSSIQQLESAGLHRTVSGASSAAVPSRGNTLKKKGSISRKSSLKRSNSHRSTQAGSLKGMSTEDKRAEDQMRNVFYTPIPTSGTPTEILANRFQAWRKMLKDLITYFREVQLSYEHKSKALLKVSNVISNTSAPSVFMTHGGISDAIRILRDYNQQAIAEANKARDIEQDVVAQLTGLRQDLAAKIKEIKSLSGDFKNTVEKEKEATRKAVAILQDALDVAEHDPHAVTGRDDPYIIRLNVDRQVERQIDEENYLHRAYLNLEGSGRELESIVVGEIQKAYNALASIMKHEADEAYDTIDQLRSGPITLPRDAEWSHFIDHDPHFVGPNIELRKLEDIYYPGKNHPAAAEVRAGMLERKSKYLKSYTPGWYVLSPTHLHEFKSADRIYTQPPVMSLYLADQKLGSHSQPGSSSHKFMLKGKQTGSMHRGHSWVFRAESYDTMLAWYDDIKSLTEKSGEERNAFVRKHARSLSGGSMRAGSVSGESAMDEDEADETPFSANGSLANQDKSMLPPQRPSPGGRFPSDLSANQRLQRPITPSEGSSDDRDIPIAPRDILHSHGHADTGRQEMPLQTPTEAIPRESFSPSAMYPNTATTTGGPVPTTAVTEPQPAAQPGMMQQVSTPPPHVPASSDWPSYQRHSSDYGSWMAPTATGVAAGAGAVGAEEYWQRRREEAAQLEAQQDRERRSEMPIEEPATVSPALHEDSADAINRTLSEGGTSTAMTDSTAPTSVLAPDSGKDNPSPLTDVPAMSSTFIPTASAGVVEHDNEGINAIAPIDVTTASTAFVPNEYEAAALAAASAEPVQETSKPTIALLDSATVAPTTVAEAEPGLNSSIPPAPMTETSLATSTLSGDQQESAAEPLKPTTSSEKHTAYDTNPDGSVNAHKTGTIFPILRHNTDTSISNLHVPGEYPKVGTF